jgi:hypothetical protein
MNGRAQFESSTVCRECLDINFAMYSGPMIDKSHRDSICSMCASSATPQLSSRDISLSACGWALHDAKRVDGRLDWKFHQLFHTSPSRRLTFSCPRPLLHDVIYLFGAGAKGGMAGHCTV